MSARPDVTVIVVSWNCRELLRECLDSVFASTGSVSFEVYVVDNASADDTVQMVRDEYPNVRLIANADNLGFAKANNMAIRASEGRYAFLLNPDAALVEPQTLDVLVEHMDRNPDVGATGCMLVGVDGRWQNSAGYHPTPTTVLANSLYLPQLTQNRIRGLILMRPRVDGPDTIDVHWVSGACMMVRREAMEEVGLLDESFFMYGEDLEWCWRMVTARWRVTHLPRIRVQHVYAGTRPNKHEVPVAWLTGLARVYMETEPGRSWWYFKTCFGLGLLLRATTGFLTGQLSRNEWTRQRAVETFALLKHLLKAESPLAPARTHRA